MSDAHFIIDLVNRFLAEPAWSRPFVEQVLNQALQRDPKAAERSKIYGRQGPGLITKVWLNQPVFSHPSSAAVRLNVDWERHVDWADLRAIVPHGSEVRTDPLPTPGSAGPAVWPFTEVVRDARGTVLLSFERRDKSRPFLYFVGLERPPQPDNPAEYDPSCFRAYVVREGDAQTYEIERRSTQTTAVNVSSLALRDGALHVSFVAAEPKVGEPLARKLIRELIVGDLLASELARKYTRIEYLATELGSQTSEPAQ